MKRLFAYASILLLIIIISNGLNPSIPSVARSTSFNTTESDNTDIIIQRVSLLVKVNNEFLPLDSLIQEGQTAEEASTFPQIVNGSAIQVNASYATILGKTQRFVIREFTILAYEVIAGESSENSTEIGKSSYDYSNPPDFILSPNSSKSEIITIQSLYLPVYSTYKFVFRLQYHEYRGDELPKNSYYSQNMTFELVAGYPEPPLFLIWGFYFISAIFIALIGVGLYGDRKFKVAE